MRNQFGGSLKCNRNVYRYESTAERRKMLFIFSIPLWKSRHLMSIWNLTSQTLAFRLFFFVFWHICAEMMCFFSRARTRWNWNYARTQYTSLNRNWVNVYFMCACVCCHIRHDFVSFFFLIFIKCNRSRQNRTAAGYRFISKWKIDSKKHLTVVFFDSIRCFSFHF